MEQAGALRWAQPGTERPKLVVNRCAVMHLGYSRMTQAGRVALSLTTRYQFVGLRTSPGPGMVGGENMHVGAAIDPRSLPTHIGNEHFVSIPDEASGTPAPGPKREAERHAISEDDGAADEKSRRRRSESDQRIIHRNDDKGWIRRHDGDIWIARNHDLLV